jgi:Arc/MetJ-type ribon-helix-helix transcriptional regulator
MASSGKLKKVTFAFPDSLLQRLRTLADQKRIASVNSVVREAVEEYVTNLERENFRQAMAEAARDPEFIRDLLETDEAFRHADAETAKVIPQW